MVSDLNIRNRAGSELVRFFYWKQIMLNWQLLKSDLKKLPRRVFDTTAAFALMIAYFLLWGLYIIPLLYIAEEIFDIKSWWALFFMIVLVGVLTAIHWSLLVALGLLSAYTVTFIMGWQWYFGVLFFMFAIAFPFYESFYQKRKEDKLDKEVKRGTE